MPLLLLLLLPPCPELRPWPNRPLFCECIGTPGIYLLLPGPTGNQVIKPPGWQCCNGHVLCNNCRNRSVKCPVCRVPLGPRGRCLLSDKLFTLLAENFPCDGGEYTRRRRRRRHLSDLDLLLMANKTGASFAGGSSPPHTHTHTSSCLFVMIPTLGMDWSGDKLLICLQCVSCCDAAVQTFGISASNLPKMAPKLALSLGACPSGRCDAYRYRCRCRYCYR